MSETYKRICAERCEWCRAGELPDALGTHWEARPEGLAPECTAPTPEQFIEEQAAELAKAKEDIARLERCIKKADKCIREIHAHRSGENRCYLWCTSDEVIETVDAIQKRGFCGASAGKS